MGAAAVHRRAPVAATARALVCAKSGPRAQKRVRGHARARLAYSSFVACTGVGSSRLRSFRSWWWGSVVVVVVVVVVVGGVLLRPTPTVATGDAAQRSSSTRRRRAVPRPSLRAF